MQRYDEKPNCPICPITQKVSKYMQLYIICNYQADWSKPRGNQPKDCYFSGLYGKNTLELFLLDLLSLDPDLCELSIAKDGLVIYGCLEDTEPLSLDNDDLASLLQKGKQ